MWQHSRKLIQILFRSILLTFRHDTRDFCGISSYFSCSALVWIVFATKRTHFTHWKCTNFALAQFTYFLLQFFFSFCSIVVCPRSRKSVRTLCGPCMMNICTSYEIIGITLWYASMNDWLTDRLHDVSLQKNTQWRSCKIYKCSAWSWLSRSEHLTARRQSESSLFHASILLFI